MVRILRMLIVCVVYGIKCLLYMMYTYIYAIYDYIFNIYICCNNTIKIGLV